MTKQTTLAGEIRLEGTGVHAGARAAIRLLPAAAETGIVFIRTDLEPEKKIIPARWDNVVDTRLCTVLGNEAGGRVATVEHLVAALSACGVDNATIEVEGPELPIMDGSARPFVDLIEGVGLTSLEAARRELVVLKPVSIEEDGKRASLAPASEGLSFDLEIVFDRKPIGTQRRAFTLSLPVFKEEIARARTFGFFEDVEKMTKLGLMRGGSLDNAVVIKDEAVMNEGGLRWQDEFVRHKLLDAVGDLALAGHRLRGAFTGYCTGHAMNNKLLRALLADSSAWRLEEAA